MNEMNEEIRTSILDAIKTAPSSDMTIVFECIPELQEPTENVIAETQIQDLLNQKNLTIQLNVVEQEKMNETIGINTLILALVFGSSLIKKESFFAVRDILIELIVQAEYMLRTEPVEFLKILDSYRPIKITTADLILAGLQDKMDIV